MITSVIDTLPDEGTNLALHVQLCEQRYLQLLTKLDQTDRALSDITITLRHIQDRLEFNQNNQLKTYLGWAGAVILALAGGLIHMATR
jgi:hypothetical protein